MRGGVVTKQGPLLPLHQALNFYRADTSSASGGAAMRETEKSAACGFNAKRL